ncbi:MAG: nucleotide exchange factor GrpE [Longimicrobiales bacterium]|nr:nucleotide exchange factor GrpE [Longimicrobiales bacterium]
MTEERPVEDMEDTVETAPDPDGHAVTPEEVEEALAESELGQDLDALQCELEELNDRHLRLAAEFTNYRRRAEAESLAVWGRAQADLVRRFLDVLDDLQRVSSLDPAEESVTVESIVEGIDLVERKFVRALQDAGAQVVEPAGGDPFDPGTMEAMMRVPTDDGEQDDRVAQLFQKGYLVDGNLVRPARVSVYKAD